MSAVLATRATNTLSLLDGFREYASAREGLQLSVATAKRYTRYAEHFCKEHGNPARVTAVTISAWGRSIESLRSADGSTKPTAASTVNVKIASVRAFFTYLVAANVRADNPATECLTMMKVPERPPRPFTRDEIKIIFEAVGTAPSTPEVIQDRAILETLYGSGVRREEAGQLRLHNIEADNMLRVVGKGDKGRVTIIVPPEFRAIRAWVLLKHADERSRQTQSEFDDNAAFWDLKRRRPDAPLFYTGEGTPCEKLSDPGSHVWRRCLVYFESTGITDATPHRFRHSFGTGLLSAGADLIAVSRMLGHKDLNTTRGYLGLEEEGFIRAAALHPRR